MDVYSIASGAAAQIHRGYHTVADPADKPPDISHLIFVVHGIGQLMHMSNIVKSCVSLQQCAVTVLEKHFTDNPPNQRLEFIPVEWRSSLKLDEGKKIHLHRGDVERCALLTVNIKVLRSGFQFSPLAATHFLVS